jgi:hypothetical protein
MISQKICAKASAMSIVYSEIRASWPFFGIDVGSFGWREEVGDDAHSILIIIPYQSLICICCISSDDSSSFRRSFCRVIVWYDDFVCCLNGFIIECSLGLLLCRLWRIPCITFTSRSCLSQLLNFWLLGGFFWFCSWWTMTYWPCIAL